MKVSTQNRDLISCKITLLKINLEFVDRLTVHYNYLSLLSIINKEDSVVVETRIC